MKKERKEGEKEGAQKEKKREKIFLREYKRKKESILSSG